MQTPMTMTWPEIFPKGKRNHAMHHGKKRELWINHQLNTCDYSRRTQKLNENESNFQHKAEERRVPFDQPDL
jgi:hypothetical protein